MRVSDTQHPNDLTVNDFISRYWSFTDDQAGTYTYNISFTYSGAAPADLTGNGANLKVNRWDGSLWTQYNTVVAGSTITLNGGNEATANFNNNAFTGRVNPPQVYLWNKSNSTGDWQVPTNWTPSRLSILTNDILQFDNNGTAIVTNVPTQTVARVIVSGNSDVSLETTGTSSAPETPLDASLIQKLFAIQDYRVCRLVVS